MLWARGRLRSGNSHHTQNIAHQRPAVKIRRIVNNKTNVRFIWIHLFVPGDCLLALSTPLRPACRKRGAPSPAAGSTKESRRRQRKRQLKHSAPATHISNNDQNIAEERHAVEQNLSLTAITAGQFKFNCVLVLRFGGKKSLLTHHRSTNSRTFGRSRSPGVSAARPMYKNPAMRSCSASFIALLTAGL